MLDLSGHEREARYVEELEEIKAGIILLEQKLADQPGSEYLQRKLARARTRQGLWEGFISTLRRKREFLPRLRVRAAVPLPATHSNRVPPAQFWCRSKGHTTGSCVSCIRQSGSKQAGDCGSKQADGCTPQLKVFS